MGTCVCASMGRNWTSHATDGLLSQSLEGLRWFMFPAEAEAVLQAHGPAVKAGGLPLSHVPPLAAVTTGAMQPRVYSPLSGDQSETAEGREEEAAETEWLTAPLTARQYATVREELDAKRTALHIGHALDGSGGSTVDASDGTASSAAAATNGLGSRQGLNDAPAEQAVRSDSRKHPLRSATPVHAIVPPPAPISARIDGDASDTAAEAEAQSEAEVSDGATAERAQTADGADGGEEEQTGAAANGGASFKRGRSKFAKPPPKLMKSINQAVAEWGMIKRGDRVCLGLSGGKDSLALLHCLVELQKKFPPGTACRCPSAPTPA